MWIPRCRNIHKNMQLTMNTSTSPNYLIPTFIESWHPYLSSYKQSSETLLSYAFRIFFFINDRKNHHLYLYTSYAALSEYSSDKHPHYCKQKVFQTSASVYSSTSISVCKYASSQSLLINGTICSNIWPFNESNFKIASSSCIISLFF